MPPASAPRGFSQPAPPVRESIDGRRLNGAGYLIEVVGLWGSHKIFRNSYHKMLRICTVMALMQSRGKTLEVKPKLNVYIPGPTSIDFSCPQCSVCFEVLIDGKLLSNVTENWRTTFEKSKILKRSWLKFSANGSYLKLSTVGANNRALWGPGCESQN